MIDDEFGEECENCQCLTCLRNGMCSNCDKCNGCNGYSKWKMNCKKYEECKNPEETIELNLRHIR